MIESHIHDWLNLLARWIHLIAGIAWIGASFYFNWLENNLDRGTPRDEGIAGSLWAVHGGGFYHLRKYATGPDRLPAPLHWFKWEAYATWLSGMALLVIIYYLNASVYLVDSRVRELSEARAIVVSLISILGSWFVYDMMCRSALGRNRKLLAGALAGYLVLLAYFLAEVFSSRAAYLHVGAAIGTMMVGNVFFVIIPVQRALVRAVSENRPPDPALGARGLLRSTHNNYLTLPVLFIMISAHFPGTYGHPLGWLVLAIISAAGIAARHYFNIRKTSKSAWWLLPAGLALLVGAMWLTLPSRAPDSTAPSVSTEQAAAIVSLRCASCHASSPTQAGFAAPPANVVLESIADVRRQADRIYQSAVLTRTMPLGNLTGMTEEERLLLSAWYDGQAEQP